MRNEKSASLCDSIIQRKSEKCVIQYNSERKSTQKKAQNCFCFFIDIILHNKHTKVMCAFFIIIIQQMSIDGQWSVEEKKRSLQLATLFVKCTHYLFVYDTEQKIERERYACTLLLVVIYKAISLAFHTQLVSFVKINNMTIINFINNAIVVT